MSQLTINRIGSVLRAQFSDHIDMRDWERRPADQADGAFLSRALAALCVKALSGADPATAGAAVIDGHDDCGIDAIHFDANTDTLLLVQSKWSGSGNATFNEGGSGKFVNGIRALFGNCILELAGLYVDSTGRRTNRRVRVRDHQVGSRPRPLGFRACGGPDPDGPFRQHRSRANGDTKVARAAMSRSTS